MNEDDVREAKLVVLAIAKLKEVCKKHKDCNGCPLLEEEGDLVRCMLGGPAISSPECWDPDRIQYEMGFNAGFKVGFEAGKERAQCQEEET